MSQHREYQRKGPRVNDGFQWMNDEMGMIGIIGLIGFIGVRH
jgi:hypothetical protein